MNHSKSTRDIWTLLAFLGAIALLIHVMLIPVLYGVYALSPFDTDSSVIAAIPKWFQVSAVTSVFATVICLALSKVQDSTKRETR